MHTAGLGHQIQEPITAKNDLNGSHKSAKICTIQQKGKLLCRLQVIILDMIPTAILLASLVTIKAMRRKQPRQTRWTQARNRHTMVWIKWIRAWWGTEHNRLTANNKRINSKLMVNSMEVGRHNLGWAIMISLEITGKYQCDTTLLDKWPKKKKSRKKYSWVASLGICLNRTLLCFSVNSEKCGV